jgi:hypothetical protein
MKRFLVGILSIYFLIIFCNFKVFAQENKWDYAGYLKTEVWVKTNNDNSHQFLSSFKNTFDLELEYKISDQWTFFFHPRYFYDFAYDIRGDEDFDTNQFKMGNTQRTEWLRDCFFDYISDTLDIRIGKQQVVWGQADGLPFLDRVMPFDLTYYWLPDFADIRIPLWMIKIEYSPWLNSTLQFLFIPDFEASRPASAYAPFAFKANNDFEDFKRLQQALGNQVVTDIHRPAKKFKNSRVGLRWRSMLGDIEYTLNWLYGYTTSAYTYTEGTDALEGGKLRYRYSRKHKLSHLLGFSFNKTFVEPGFFQGLTLRGEFAYIHNEPAYYGTQGSRKRTEQTDKYTYVLGFDKYLFTNWLFSLQFAQYITKDKTWDDYNLLNTYTYGLMDKVENFLTLKISTDFMHERLKPEVLIIYSDDNDGRITFKTKCEVKDNLWLTLGFHHFWGSVWGSNGEFRNNDHLFLEIKYTF